MAFSCSTQTLAAGLIASADCSAFQFWEDQEALKQKHAHILVKVSCFKEIV